MSKRKSSANKANDSSGQSQKKAKTAPQPIDLKSFKRDFGDGLHPTSQWKLSWLKHFCEWSYKGGLGFTKEQFKNIKLLPEEEVFAQCTARKDEIMAGKWDLERMLQDVPQWDGGRVEQNVNSTFSKMQRVLYQYEGILPTEENPTPKEPIVDTLAMQLVHLCGFNDGREFDIAFESVTFKLAGKDINSKADVYVATRHGAPGQLVLIWEDKLSRTQKTEIEGKTGATLLENSVAQIIGEMISVHYQNKLRKYKPAEVYAVRLIDDMVAFFRMEMTGDEIKALCEDGVTLSPKLKVCLSLLSHNSPKGHILRKNYPH